MGPRRNPGADRVSACSRVLRQEYPDATPLLDKAMATMIFIVFVILLFSWLLGYYAADDICDE
jgi:hypothetical protein